MSAIILLRPVRARSGFSLIEVLLAIMILGIGIISIAALFPAGIAQQRLANEDIMGPIVANHAISVIRAKVSPDDFGTFDEYARFFPTEAPQPFFSRTQPGDWDWMRPGFLHENDGTTVFDERGAIDIFSRRHTLQRWGTAGIATSTEWPNGWPDQWTAMGEPVSNAPLFGIPYNSIKYEVDDTLNPPDDLDPPHRIISQRERYYPMQSSLVDADEISRPQYVWDCMFRRYQGRMYVAIFVYRVSSDNAAVPFIVPADIDNPDFPPMPFWLDLTDASNGDLYPDGVWNVRFNNERAIPFVSGTSGGNIDVLDPRQSWQRTRQWLLDQNNNIHRVVGVDEESDDAEATVELSRPLQPVMTGWWSNTTDGSEVVAWGTPFNNVPYPSDSPNFYYGNPQADTASFLPAPYTDRGVVTDLWYIPRVVEYEHAGEIVEFTLTPVYVTVKEL